MKLLRDPHADVRRNAARILEEIGTQKCLIELRRASADPRDTSAALAAKQALDGVMVRVKEQKAAASQAATKPTTRGR
jgi:HEAT repeat protein